MTASVAAEASMRLRSGRAISRRRRRTSRLNDDPSLPVSFDSTESSLEVEAAEEAADEASRVPEEVEGDRPSSLSTSRALVFSSARGSEDEKHLLAAAARHAVHLVSEARSIPAATPAEEPFEP